MEHYRKILVATDLSEFSDRAAARAMQIQEAGDATIVVVNAVDYIPPAYVAAEMPAEYASPEILVGQAQNKVNEWCGRVGLAGCEQVVRAGSARQVVCSTAEDMGADLIVTGTHGTTGFKRLLGSTARALVNSAECDVLIVR